MHTPASRMRGISLVSLLSIVLTVLAGCSSDNTPSGHRGTDPGDLAAGFAALEQQQYDAAIAAADRQLQSNPGGRGSAEAHYLRGRVYEQRVASSSADAAANLQSARGAYIQALARSPEPKLEGLIRAGVANVAYWQEDYTTAAQQWQAAYPLLEQPPAKSYALYRIGLSMQRMGRFDEADKVFAEVQRLYPGTDAAQRAKDHQGHRAFSVQVATFASPQNASNAIASLRSMGLTPSQTRSAAGHYVVMVGPVATYPAAKALQARISAHFPDALIVP
jgi:tetratricopeptide (TPR) repeat protein